MQCYSIKIPKIVNELFDNTSYELNVDVTQKVKVSIDANVFTPSDYIVSVLSIADGKFRLSIMSPSGASPKTVVVTRDIMSDGTLTLNVLYYGLIKTEHLRALASCARDYGCSTITVNRDVLTTINSW